MSDPRVYETEYGWVAADDGGWLPGVFKTEAEARAVAGPGAISHVLSPEVVGERHDPLCPFSDTFGAPCMYCALIARVRADEQAKQPRVEIEAALGEPTTCRVWVNGSLVFTGIDLASAASEFPPHYHHGDEYDPDHCVYTRADGERCMKPLDRSSG